MSQKDLSAFGNRFSVGRATAGSTSTTVNENVQVLGALSVGQNLSSSGNLSVSGTSSLAGLSLNSLDLNAGKTTIDSNGNIVSLGNLSLAGVATVNNFQARGTLGVSGASTLASLSAGNTSIGGTFGVSGASTLASLSAGNTSIGGTLGVSGASTLGSLSAGSLGVSGASTLGSLSAGNTSVGGTFGVSGASTLGSLSAGNTSVGGTLGVTGVSTLNSLNLSSIDVGSGNSTFSNLTATGAVSLGGNTTLLGNLFPNSGINVNSGKFVVDTSGHLSSQGNITSSGNLSLGGVATFTGGIYSSSAAYLNNLNINSGQTTIDSNGNIVSLGSLRVGGNATFSNMTVTGTASVTGNLNMSGNITGSAINGSSLNVSGAAGVNGDLTATGQLNGNTLSILGASVLGGSVNVQSGKFVIDINGNVTMTGSSTLSNTSVGGTLGVTGASTLGTLSAGNTSVGGTLGVTGASTFSSSVNVQSGKFMIDSSGNVGIGSSPSGAVMDIYNNNSRIRMRGTGSGIEWNNTGSAVLSSMIYDTDSKLKLYSSTTSNPKMVVDSNNILLMNDPSVTTLANQKYTAITPIGILTITGRWVVNVSQTGTTMAISGPTAAALATAAAAGPKSYIYIDNDIYKNMLLYATAGTNTSNLTFIDLISGTTVNVSANLTDVNVYVVSSCVTRDGKILSTSLFTPDANPRVVVSNQYGQLGLSA
jgi:hypothetical protein